MTQQQLDPIGVVSVQGSGKQPYIVRIFEAGHGGHCTCPAWKNMGGTPESRACKHIKKVAKENPFFMEQLSATIDNLLF